MSWFPLPESLLYGNDEWRSLTTTAKVMLLGCMSEANVHAGKFYRGNDDWRCRLSDAGVFKRPISRNTLRATRDQLIQWVSVTPGRRSGSLSVASEYDVRPSLWKPSEMSGQHFGQMPRFMFEDILWKMGRDAALAYTYLSAEFWRNRDRYADRKSFFVALGELQRESGLRDFYQHIGTLHRQFVFNDGSHLFEFEGHRRITFREWQKTDEKFSQAVEVLREKEIQSRAKELTTARELSRIDA